MEVTSGRELGLRDARWASTAEEGSQSIPRVAVEEEEEEENEEELKAEEEEGVNVPRRRKIAEGLRLERLLRLSGVSRREREIGKEGGEKEEERDVRSY